MRPRFLVAVAVAVAVVVAVVAVAGLILLIIKSDKKVLAYVMYHVVRSIEIRLRTGT